MSGLVQGKLAFVTGAGSGIGRATCKVLAREGASVVAADKNLKNAEETINALLNVSKNHHTSLIIDVKDSKSIKDALQQTVDRYKKPPSILVNCAGIIKDSFILKLSEEDFQDVIDVNLKGTFMVMKTFAQAIIENGVEKSSFINIASIFAKIGNIGQANYCASKAGVDIITRTACKEFAKFGIRCNSVLPGFIATPMMDTVPEKSVEKLKSMVTCKRLGQPEEVAEVIVFLASDRSSYVNGSSIDVNGGLLMA